MEKLSGKTAIVTGAAQGIGRAIALLYAREGVQLAICDIQSEKLEKTAVEMRELGARTLASRCDVAISGEVGQFVAEAEEALGVIDILVNNAGIQIRAPVVQMQDEEWNRTLAVNLAGCFYFTRAVLPGMLARKQGHIINISSDSGKLGWPTGGAYCASKFGVLGFTEAVAAEVAQEGIHVNAICPGGVITEMSERAMTPEGEPYDRTGYLQPEEIAQVALFLATEASSAFYGAALDAWGRVR